MARMGVAQTGRRERDSSSAPGLVLAVALLVLCTTGRAQAHGVTMTTRLMGDDIVVAFAKYSTGEPMAYAEVAVYAPGKDDVAFQDGYADNQGRFAFLPDSHGAWRIVVNDGMGHRAETTVDVEEGGSPAGTEAVQGAEKGAGTGAEMATASTTQTAVAAAPRWMGVTLGVSIILNIFLVLSYVRRRRA
ncbi:hypothetical protein [Oceanidesulfovibrio marinus]|uniref:Nickel transport protein n=1 Tax=Oceanidesulfovibrio marinus TaxID=370038 RepID=A0ABX6NEJ5_9BACT|nr:hypothetical protein [Oceanidesulfovibrio marinus]QJT08180.1 hypothetical protein E8L03_04240 [Oceanidesulfovibrio marinus]